MAMAFVGDRYMWDEKTCAVRFCPLRAVVGAANHATTCVATRQIAGRACSARCHQLSAQHVAQGIGVMAEHCASFCCRCFHASANALAGI